ncbi:MAG: hypothetical protein F4039_04650 [Gammaproteobacteria bacterium]|nr:hypothetical protein [Gammaproteobacteria bacterium]
MKKVLIIISAMLVVIATTTAVVLFAQSDSEDDSNTCKWVAQNQLTSAGDYHSPYFVNSLYWNECTGDIYHITVWYYSDGTTRKDFTVTKIDLD